MKKRENYNILCIISIILIYIFIVTSTSLEADSNSKSNNEKELCFENIKKLDRAIEMFNMDHTDGYENVFPGQHYESTEEILRNLNYLKEDIYWPNRHCSYGAIALTSTGTFFFFFFCYTNNKPAPEIDKKFEKDFSQKYKNKQIKHIKEIEAGQVANLVNLMANLSSIILKNPFVLIGILIILSIIIVIIINKKLKTKD